MLTARVVTQDNEALIERGQAPAIPFGWYHIAYSNELAVGQVKPMNMFGLDFVLWRGQDGQVRATEAFCKHLGAHLGYGGKVIENDLACPFHSWRYDGGGAVTAIPYAKVVPPQLKRECLYSYPVVEINRCITLWYHPKRVAPMWEPLKVPELDDPKWAPFDSYEWIINTQVRDVAENSVDYPHFHYVHGVRELPQHGEVTEDDWTRSVITKVKVDTPRGPIDGFVRSVMRGPGQGYVLFHGLLETLLVGTTVPLGPSKTFSRLAFTQATGIAGTVFGRTLIYEIVQQLEQDKVIWDHKRQDHQPTLVNGDGPINEFRQYFAKFFA